MYKPIKNLTDIRDPGHVLIILDETIKHPSMFFYSEKRYLERDLENKYANFPAERIIAFEMTPDKRPKLHDS